MKRSNLEITKRSLLSVCAAVLVSACAVGPDYTELTPDIPERFNSDQEELKPLDIALDWWKCFQDQDIEELVKAAIENNNSIKVAVARLEQSRASRKENFLGLFPEGDVTATSVKFRNSNQGQFSGFGNGNKEQEYSSVSASASWEIDLFGRIRRKIENASAKEAESEFNLDDVRRIIIADTIQQYLMMRGAQSRLAVARGNLDLQRSTSDITQSLTVGGELSNFDYQRTLAQLKVTEAEIPMLDSILHSAINSLSVLTTIPAHDLELKLKEQKTVVVCSFPTSVGIPSDLLKRRPDLKAAERKVAAATAKVGVEIGEYFPKFELFGTLGYEAINLGALNRRGDESYSYGPSLTLPIFQYNRIATRVEGAKAGVIEMLHDYENKILMAIAETDDAIVQLKNHQERVKSLREAAQASAKATEIAQAQYKIGEIDLLTILDVQRTQLQTESSLALAEQEHALAVVLLYRALGGGWNIEQQQG